jgi:hypothetical protein
MVVRKHLKIAIERPRTVGNPGVGDRNARAKA